MAFPRAGLHTGSIQAGNGLKNSYLVAFGQSRHRAWVVGQSALECSLGSRGRPFGGLFEQVLKPLGGSFGASFGALGGLLGVSWGLLRALWGPLGAEG